MWTENGLFITFLFHMLFFYPISPFFFLSFFIYQLKALEVTKSWKIATTSWLYTVTSCTMKCTSIWSRTPSKLNARISRGHRKSWSALRTFIMLVQILLRRKRFIGEYSVEDWLKLWMYEYIPGLEYRTTNEKRKSCESIRFTCK